MRSALIIPYVANFFFRGSKAMKLLVLYCSTSAKKDLRNGPRMNKISVRDKYSVLVGSVRLPTFVFCCPFFSTGHSSSLVVVVVDIERP